ncbi:hypothetical protein [Immundisolibacter sp.]
MNTASRIEALNKRLGTRILASEGVIDGLAGIDCRRVGRFLLAGKGDAVEVYELLPVPSAAQALARRPFESALDAFMAGDAVAARRRFGAALAADPGDTVAAFYIDVLQGLLQGLSDKLPPAGVIVVPK